MRKRRKLIKRRGERCARDNWRIVKDAEWWNIGEPVVRKSYARAFELRFGSFLVDFHGSELWFLLKEILIGLGSTWRIQRASGDLEKLTYRNSSGTWSPDRPIANSNRRLKPDYFVVDPIYFCTFAQRAHLSYDLSPVISRPDLFSSFVTRYFHALLCELLRDGLLAEDNIRRWLSSFLFSQMARHSMLSKGDLNPPFSEIPRGAHASRTCSYVPLSISTGRFYRIYRSTG